MKLRGTASDTRAVDARTRDNARPAGDNAPNDNTPPFDGVLADVKTEAKNSKVVPPSAGKAENVAAPTDGTTKPTIDPAGENTIIDAFIQILGREPGTTAAGQEDVKKKDDGHADSSSDKTSGTDAVDSLLKRAVSDDETTTNAAATAATPAPAPDLMSILLLGAALNKTPQSAPPPALPSGGQAASRTAGAVTLDGPRKDSSSAPQATTDDNEVIISDLSITSHIAPVAPKPNAALPAQDPKDASKGRPLPVTAASTGAGTARPAPNDAAASAASISPRRDVPPSVDGVTTLLQSVPHAAVRDIARAIGNLASGDLATGNLTARPAPTVAGVETSKAALGAARTMRLQMNPADLGTVDIRMHITGQTLDVQLTISKAETLGMVSRERDTLATALGDQNYQLNSLVIQDGGAAAPSGGQNATTQGDTSGGGGARADRQGGAGNSDTRGGGQPGHDPERWTRNNGRRRDDDGPSPRAGAAMSGGGSLYV